ncbi:MFS general substrate transporter [Lophiostoma macrostomum CBS 122681]|uniref:MFS general substrate transporter n=1 Tax=Lophiostoma macrostomum CBS 122681 TaxID=1314788 RepID=A0A6A6SJZ4_9PLEO|nr:MFS general substrate transporter [Lophiostoma macrostomum CBS 122681]
MTSHSTLSAPNSSCIRRQTIWPFPTPWSNTDYEMSVPCPATQELFHEQTPRWTNAFDHEARASRMSYMASNTLLPAPAITSVQHQRWIGTQSDRKDTWDSQFQEKALPKRAWSEVEDVKRRPSAKLRPPPPLTKVEKSLIDGRLVTLEVLEHEFDGSGTDSDPYLVGWIENDVGNPMNFSTLRKWTNSMILALAVFMVSIASSGFSQGTEDIKAEFGISQVTALLITSAFVLGFAIGALALSPLSEVYGRRELYYLTFGAFVGFSAVTPFASSMAMIVTLRFFGGIAGSFTQAVAPAIAADMFEAQERGMVLSILTLAGLFGQTLGPIVCGFLDAAYGWRSIALLVTAASLPTWIVLTFTFPETYAPVLLQRRAAKLTRVFGKQHVVAGIAPKPVAQQLRIGILRPWIMLAFEPIVTLLSLFLSVVHGTLFLLFAAYPIVFQQVRGWPQGVASLPFLAIALGIVLSLLYVALVDQRRYARVVTTHNGAAPPEARLPPAMLGAVALPVGLFWFAATNSPETFWLVSVSAGVLFGFGMVLLYMSLTNYLVDAYLGYAASALAASTVLRSVAGAVFPLFTNKMYADLGIHWASSVPGYLALVFVPCLIGFWKWGHILRRKTRFGMEAAKLSEMRK